MVMRWKILELAEGCSSLDHLLQELQAHPEFGFADGGGLQLLRQYKDILPAPLQDELQTRSEK